jgi:hypothetical protein
MSKKKLTLEDLKKLGNSYGGIQANTTEDADSKTEDAEGNLSGKHGQEKSGNKRTPYLTDLNVNREAIKKK